MCTEINIPVEWRPVVGYEGSYEVSNYGQIRSLPLVRQAASKPSYYKGKIIKQSVSMYGYYRIGLTKNGIQRYYFVHRLVAQAFIENPNNYPSVNHIEGNRLDNRSWMLEWCTASMNAKHSFEKLNRKANKPWLGKSSPVAKAIYQCDLNGNVIAKFSSMMAAEKVTGISDSDISAVAMMKRNQAGGFKWRYVL